MTAALPLIGPDVHSEEWKALRVYDPGRKERPIVFGASAASLVMTNPLEAFLLATGRKPPFEGNEFTEFGVLVEPVTLELYRRRTKLNAVANKSMWFHGEYPWMAATPDAFSEDYVPSRPPQLMQRNVQCKSAGDFRFHADDDDAYGEEGTDQTPIDVLWQVQAEMEVMGLEITDIPVLKGRKIKIYTVPREPTLAQALVAAEKELFERIINDDPPEPNWQHPNTRHCLQALYGLQQGTAVDLGEDAAEHWLECQRLKIVRDNAEAEIEERKCRILAAMGSAELGNLPGGGKQLKRTVIKDSFVTQADVDKLIARVGQVGRRGHERLTERKAKP